MKLLNVWEKHSKCDRVAYFRCQECRRFKTDEGLRIVEDKIIGKVIITDGFCDECLKLKMEEVRKIRKRNNV